MIVMGVMTEMANVQKYTRGQIGGLTRHYERTQKEDGTYYEFSNQEIDVTKIHLNYNLAPERDGGQLGFINQRTSEVQCLKRADVNVMCSWVVTAPKSLAEDEYKLFFSEVYNFLNERYAYGSDRNVISAYVHMDESTPHLHYAFVPVVYDAKKGLDKVSAKMVIDRLDLQTFHPDLEQCMSEIFGREIGILNDATKDGNKSIDELKRGTAQEKVDELEAKKEQAAVEVSNLQNTAFEIQDDINDLEHKKKRIEGQMEAVQSRLKSLKGNTRAEEKINSIPVTISRPAFGSGDGKKDRVTLLLSDWENVKKTAILGARNFEQEKKNNSREKALDEREKNISQREKSVKMREDIVADDEAGLEAQRKRADYWGAQARSYEADYNRVLRELNQLKGRGKDMDRGAR